MNWFRTLRGRLITYFLVVSVFMVGLSGFLAFFLAAKSLRESVFDRLAATAELKEESLKRWLDERLGDMLLLSDSPDFSKMAEDLVQAPGDTRAQRRARHVLYECLSKVVISKPGFEEVMLLSWSDGRIIASTDLFDVGGFRMYASYFKKGREGPFIQYVYPNPVTGLPAITISIPVKSAMGRNLAVLAAHLDLERLDRLMVQRIGLGRSGETYLVDRYNVFITSKRFGRKPYPRGVHSRGIDEAVSGNNGRGMYDNYAGEPVIAVYRWLEDLQLALLVEMPTSEAYAPARKLAGIIIIVGLMAAIVLAFSFFFLARRIARPIEAIAETARRVGRGYLDQTAPVMTGGEIGVLATVFNQMIRDLRQTLEELRNSAQKYRNLFDNAPEGIAITTSDGRLITSNQAFMKMFGIKDPESIRKIHISDLYADPEQRDAVLDDILADGGRPSFEVDMKDVSGNKFRAGISMRMIRYENGDAVQAVIRDVTRLRSAELELRRTRDYLSNVIDSMTSVIICVDPQIRVTQWSREAEAITGIAAGDALHRHLNDIFPESAVRAEDVSVAISENREKKIDKARSEIGGQLRFLDVVINPLRSEEMQGAVIRLDDVSHRVRLEELMVQTEKMISVGGLAAGMAHEINNPLGGILQSAEMIERRLSNDNPRNEIIAQKAGTDIAAVQAYMAEQRIPFFLEGIRECGIRAAKIVKDMLGFSHRSDGEKKAVDLADVMDRALELASNDYDLKKRFDFKKIDVEKDYDPEMSKVVCERQKIEQVILNLLRNSAQAMSDPASMDDRPRIKVGFRPKGNYAVIEVSDNGPGMPEDVRRRIFEPFFTTKPVGIGTGLGLSVSYFIVAENHGGTMEVKSSPDRGTTFIVSLPLS